MYGNYWEIAKSLLILQILDNANFSKNVNAISCFRREMSVWFWPQSELQIVLKTVGRSTDNIL